MLILQPSALMFQYAFVQLSGWHQVGIDHQEVAGCYLQAVNEYNRYIRNKMSPREHR